MEGCMGGVGEGCSQRTLLTAHASWGFAQDRSTGKPHTLLQPVAEHKALEGSKGRPRGGPELPTFLCGLASRKWEHFQGASSLGA